MHTYIKATFKLIPPYFRRTYSKFSESNLKKLLEKMPKEPKHIADAQKQRFKIKDRFQNYVPGKVTVQVLGTGAEGAPKALYMFTDHSRYLFNCGEGTQRLAHEHKMKLSKLEHIFVTEPTWSNMGGLPGVSLTIQDVGVPQITLHGPAGLDELFVATRRFVILRDLKICMADCKPEDRFEDNVMSVQYVPITKRLSVIEGLEKGTQCETVSVSDASTTTRDNRKRRSQSQHRGESESCVDSEDEIDYYAHEQSGSRGNTTIERISHEEREQNTTMSYICRLHARPGALSLEKCVERGVPPGPLLGQLKSGKDITLTDGTVVKSEDVCNPDDPGPVMLVVDCPSEEYLDLFVSNEEFKKHQAVAKCDEDLAYLVVHFTPSNIVQNPRYKEWVDGFSPSTQHLLLNDSNTCMGSAAVHRIQYKLNMLHSSIFPLLQSDSSRISVLNGCEPRSKKAKLESVEEPMECTDNIITNEDVFEQYVKPNTFCNFHLRPKKGLDRSGELLLDPSQYISETEAIEGFSEALKQMKSNIAARESCLTSTEPFPKILFLGTGSCIPNKTRNTSGILVQIDEGTYILMDCGEGTYGQLVRFFGHENVKTVLRDLKAVYISHLHADHHIGLVGVLKGRRRALQQLGRPLEPLQLIAPNQILSWLHFYHRRFEKITDDYTLVKNQDLAVRNRKISPEESAWAGKLGMKEIRTVGVRHCPNAFGVRFNSDKGWSFTYSGDTMPSDQLALLGLDCDLLIHEATMEDELANEAIFKMHSTTSQAIQIGHSMNAKHIILTHFSQRYAKLPRFNDNFSDNVSIAFDNMFVTLDELPLIPLMYPVLRLMFAEHYEELETKAVKRQLNKERRDASRDGTREAGVN